jgi:hypothetical protein
MEKNRSTQGKYGAVKVNKPKKLMLISLFRRAHKYTIMKVREKPRKGMLKYGAATCRLKGFHWCNLTRRPNAPMRRNHRKSAVLPLNDPSSRSLEYRTLHGHRCEESFTRRTYEK